MHPSCAGRAACMQLCPARQLLRAGRARYNSPLLAAPVPQLAAGTMQAVRRRARSQAGCLGRPRARLQRRRPAAAELLRCCGRRCRQRMAMRMAALLAGSKPQPSRMRYVSARWLLGACIQQSRRLHLQPQRCSSPSFLPSMPCMPCKTHMLPTHPWTSRELSY